MLEVAVTPSLEGLYKVTGAFLCCLSLYRHEHGTLERRLRTSLPIWRSVIADHHVRRSPPPGLLVFPAPTTLFLFGHLLIDGLSHDPQAQPGASTLADINGLVTSKTERSPGVPV
jgi:hypothetical protein